MNAFVAFVSEINRFVIGMTILGAQIFVWYVVLVKGVSASTELTMAIVTTAGTFSGLVLGYHFGSSAGSAAKDRALAVSVPVAPIAPLAPIAPIAPIAPLAPIAPVEPVAPTEEKKP